MVNNMPKLKNKSSVTKRFKVTSSGKVIATQSNKQHNMIKRSKKQLRRQRGTTILNLVESSRIKKYIPYI